MDDATREGVARFLRNTAGRTQDERWVQAFNEAADEIEVHPYFVMRFDPAMLERYEDIAELPVMPLSRPGMVRLREVMGLDPQDVELARELLSVSDRLIGMRRRDLHFYSAGGEIRLRLDGEE